MQTVNIHQAKTHLSRLIEAVLAGEEVVIAKAGKPIVQLVVLPDSSPPVRELGRLRGKAWAAPDAWEPMTGEELDDWEGGSLFPAGLAEQR